MVLELSQPLKPKKNSSGYGEITSDILKHVHLWLVGH
jgi:hypothetical protein